ncbi:cation:proton antiporter family protein [Porticoccus sp.]|jgi:Kef-type K+ transport system membrane component KefB|uniref:cation:proton antiporter n=1 Tax=Porticoccus sp. TaxID=2024853 RepID=UPI000C41D39F|nr:cation:proton antiporter family protein [Porticoccus sp.]MAZ69499.1 sodium:proton exchanger [Porticoccus sp.]|tara:strand:- start:20313 stop:21965 length:1653 start_codon:yes stop_codon:yes gene_type:complete
MLGSVFLEIGVILGLAAIGGFIAQFLRQPLIVAFIAIGILVGPSGLGMVSHSSEIELFARLGIALLLFVVGLKLDLHIIRTVGPVALASGLGQVLFTSVVGYLIALLMGMSPVTALYVAVALTFSSTIIIVKLLSDKREVDSLHGRIAVGFLIVQDIVVVLVMIGLTAFGQAEEGINIGREALVILLKGALMLIGVALLMRYVLPRLLQRMAHSSELLMLFAIAWAVLGASIGDLLGFSKEVGAFLAGISIASTAYREQVAARLVSLRDFLLLFFFIELGASLDILNLGGQLGTAMIFSLFVLVGNPLIVMAIMGYMGYRKRTGFLAGLTVAQISEFSLILAALGLSLGHLEQDTVGLITLVGLITISVSTYMILYSHPLYARLAPWLSIFERKVAYRELSTTAGDEEKVDILLIGLGRFGASVATNLRQRGCRLLAVDFDPQAVQYHTRDGYAVRYGDAEDPEFIASLPLSRATWVVSTVRDRAINRMILHGLKEQGYKGKVAISAAGSYDAKFFEQAGVDMVLVPYTDAAREAAAQLFPQKKADNPQV